jgi:hypothetical protein
MNNIKQKILFFLLILSNFSFSQTWNKLSGLPSNVTIKKIETGTDGKIYVVTNDDYPFYSSDGGANWQPFNAPPSSIFLLNVFNMHVNKSNNRVFFGTSFHGISYTSNLGNTWGQEFFSTNPVSALHEGIHQIASSNDTIVVSGDYTFSGSLQRYFYSTNNGNTWSSVEQGLGICEDMILDNSKWIVATGLGIQETSDMGNTWNVLAFNNASIYSCRSIIKANANNYYCVLLNIPLNQYQIYQSSNLTSWTLLHSFTSANYYDANYAPQSNSLLLATKEGLIQYSLSTNTATTISLEPITDTEEGVTSNAIYYGTSYNVGVRTAIAPSFLWTSLTNGLVATSIYSTSNFLLNNNKLFSTSPTTRLVSINPNLSLNNWNFGIPIDNNNLQNPNNIFLKKNSTAIFTGGNTNIFKSVDNGATWLSITTQSVMPFNTQGHHNFHYFNTTKNNQLYCAMDNDNGILRRSTNNGASWDSVFSNFSVLRYSNVVSDGSNTVYASYFTIGLQNKIIKSVDGGNTWTDISDPFLNSLNSDFKLLIDNANNLYVATTTKIYQMPSQGIFNQVTVPWNTASADITKLSIVFDINNKMVVNASGNEFCNECGVYRYDYTNWENLMQPNIVAPNTPIAGIELLYDSIPLVRTNYAMQLGSYNDMGYYYYSSITLDIDEIHHTVNTFVYPNPCSDFIVLSNGHFTGNYIIVNAIGETVLSGANSINSANSIDIRKIPSGVYSLIIFNQKEKISYKFIKK